MAKLLKDETARRLMASLDVTESLTQPRNRAVRRRIRSVGGSQRSYVEITSSSSPSEYIGNVLEYPGGPTSEEDVKIEVFGATTNEYNDGYSAFADLGTNVDGDDVYYIDGYLLG